MMQTYALRGFLTILIGMVIGCQSSRQLNPIEKAKTQRFQKFQQTLKQKAQQFSSSSQLKLLAAGNAPSLSPNGQYIAFSANYSEASASLWVMNIDGQNLRVLSTFDWSMNPQWSPDSNTIIFQSYGPKNWLNPISWLRETRTNTIWAVDVDGSNQRQLISQNKEGDQYPFWSPDGKHIAWTRGKNLWIANSQGKNARPLATDSKWFMKTKRWSSDSQTIYFKFDFNPSSGQEQQLQCNTQFLQALDITQPHKNRIVRQAFIPVLHEKLGPFQYCVDKSKLFKVNRKNKTSQYLDIQGPILLGHPSVSKEQQTLVFGLEIKSGITDSILTFTIDE